MHLKPLPDDELVARFGPVPEAEETSEIYETPEDLHRLKEVLRRTRPAGTTLSAQEATALWVWIERLELRLQVAQRGRA